MINIFILRWEPGVGVHHQQCVINDDFTLAVNVSNTALLVNINDPVLKVGFTDARRLLGGSTLATGQNIIKHLSKPIIIYYIGRSLNMLFRSQG